MSWVHHDDFVAAVHWLIDHEEIAGVVNVASPNPVPNAEFMRTLREACGAPFGLPDDEVDARTRRNLHAHGNRTRLEEPQGGPNPPTREWLRVQLSDLAERGARISVVRGSRTPYGSVSLYYLGTTASWLSIL